MALSEAKKAADKRYMDKLDNIMVRPYREEGAAIRAAAAAAGMSVQGYILCAVRAWMENGQAGVVPPDALLAVSPEGENETVDDLRARLKRSLNRSGTFEVIKRMKEKPQSERDLLQGVDPDLSHIEK